MVLQAEEHTRAYLVAWRKRVKPWLEKYLPGIAQRLERMARAEAGGRTSPKPVEVTEKAAWSGVTEALVRKMSDTDLIAMHRRCHDLGGDE